MFPNDAQPQIVVTSQIAGPAVMSVAILNQPHTQRLQTRQGPFDRLARGGHRRRRATNGFVAPDPLAQRRQFYKPTIRKALEQRASGHLLEVPATVVPPPVLAQGDRNPLTPRLRMRLPVAPDPLQIRIGDIASLYVPTPFLPIHSSRMSKFRKGVQHFFQATR